MYSKTSLQGTLGCKTHSKENGLAGFPMFATLAILHTRDLGYERPVTRVPRVSSNQVLLNTGQKAFEQQLQLSFYHYNPRKFPRKPSASSSLKRSLPAAQARQQIGRGLVEAVPTVTKLRRFQTSHEKLKTAPCGQPAPVGVFIGNSFFSFTFVCSHFAC